MTKSLCKYMRIISFKKKTERSSPSWLSCITQKIEFGNCHQPKHHKDKIMIIPLLKEMNISIRIYRQANAFSILHLD